MNCSTCGKEKCYAPPVGHTCDASKCCDRYRTCNPTPPAAEEKSHHYKVVETFIGGEFPEKKAKVLMEAIGLLLASERQRIAEVCLESFRDCRGVYETGLYCDCCSTARHNILTALKTSGVEVKE